MMTNDEFEKILKEIKSELEDALIDLTSDIEDHRRNQNSSIIIDSSSKMYVLFKQTRFLFVISEAKISLQVNYLTINIVTKNDSNGRIFGE